MEKSHNNDTFLGRWISGELSKEELSKFKETKAYKQFEFINKESQLLSGPEIDVEAALLEVKRSTKLKQKRSKAIRLWQTVGIAAVLVISVGLYLNSSKTYSNEVGSIQTIVLDDGSVIELNANSSVSHKRFFWLNNKLVKLKGEALFKVQKGNGFIVEASNNIVKVLGTEFNIKDRINFELTCYEGQVELSNKDEAFSAKTLTKGMQVNILNNVLTETTLQENSPSWLSRVSKFNAQPLYLVLEELSQYFNISFNTKNIDTDRLYSGSFKHHDLDLALKSTLVPMGIKYQKEQDTYILSD
ncbi:FecR family protein [Seonamhaeicola marinus]|uniref:DUF4974 domain-containing protein n=1 Tax=Seonamhaeicola marinus TaxID=1912246 RepID=A0A5D0I5R8_9FLAO|nr:FecR domain-containing protein [Seonamhaeicola marinus]TYA78728.1 DUF4974 domain-containing protein [Seonamhaeicola marinus]